MTLFSRWIVRAACAPALVLAVLWVAAPPAAAAAPKLAALTRDIDRDGRVDAIDVRTRSRRLAGRVRVDRHARAGRPARSGRWTRVPLREAGRPDTALRPRGRARGRRLAVRDGAPPALVGVALRDGRAVLAWSEPVHIRGRARPKLRLRLPGRTVTGRLRGGKPALETAVGARVAVLPRRVSAGARIGAVRDAAGNRVKPFKRAVGRAHDAARDAPPRGGEPPAEAPTAPPERPAAPAPPAPNPAPAPVFPVLESRPATAARSFVDSIGVNVHLSYMSTAYYHYGAVRDALVDLGVRHIRDGACAGCTWLFPRFLDLADRGIRSTLIIGSPRHKTGTLAENLESVRTSLRPAVEAVEGPNEYDASGDLNWAPALRGYQQELYERVAADPALRNLDVIGPSFVHAGSRKQAGDLSAWMTHGNLHAYAGGEPPGRNLDSERALASAVSGERHVVATEAGYHNALATTGGHRPVDEATAGAYLPNMYLEHFRRGVTRTFAYELVDERPEPALTDMEQHFGLLRRDFSPKPAYTALKGLIASIGDGVPAGGDAALRYEVAGADASLRQLLLARPDGGFSLVLWRDVRIWDPVARERLDVAPLPATVRLGEQVAGAAVQRDGATVSSLDQPLEIPLDVGVAPVVVRLTAPRSGS